MTLTGPEFWRSLAEQAPEEAQLLGLLPELRPAAADPVDRRRLLQLMAASLALGGLSACGPDDSAATEAIPYVRTPAGIVAGRESSFATAVTREGYATGILVRHRMGRPIKIEGNPDHPASLGAADAVTQAAILDLYDPDRSRAPLQQGRITAQSTLIAALMPRLSAIASRGGDGLRLLSGATTSPSVAAQIALLRQRYPRLRWHRWEDGRRDTARNAARLAFGRSLDTVLRPGEADVILAIESDMLDAAPGHLAYASAFAERRRSMIAGARPHRLYAIERTPTLTGSNADHRFAVSTPDLERIIRAIAARIGIGEMPAQDGAALPPWVAQIADDLLLHKGAALVHVGPEQSLTLHALALAMNDALGAPGRTLRHIVPVETAPEVGDQGGEAADLAALVTDMKAGAVDTLVILGGNPVFTAPADLGFGAALSRLPFSLHLGTHQDETAMAARWHLPQAHELESWSDARAHDGTATILQPQLRPLWAGWSVHETLALLNGDTAPDGYAILRSLWAESRKLSSDGADSFWFDAIRSGVVPDSRSPELVPTLNASLLDLLPKPEAPRTGMTALFRPDPFLAGGRYANSGWLQELPRPLTKLTWDNAALIAPATATRLGLRDGDIVSLATAAGEIRAPIWRLPGQARDCVTLPFGFGRRIVGRVGAGTGFDVYPLRTSRALNEAALADPVKTGSSQRLASTQDHDRMEGREIVRMGSVADFMGDPDQFSDKAVPQSLYPEMQRPETRRDGHAWGMAIDLSSCIGCGACTAACQAENNIAIVGKEEMAKGRELHWIRVDRYYAGDPEAPQTVFQPVPCMHCETAPCEVVCPVEATMHDADGLNVMIYNRCVGTRFCSNNCPYKVRRFNYFDYAGEDPRPPISWNPDLTVRGRGVMEKCTYCIQRIRETKITADREERAIRDGEIVTACQASCPTQAIIFGDITDPQSAVARRKATPLDYALLGELGTRPRTTYQRRLLNPNPAIAAETGEPTPPAAARS